MVEKVREGVVLLLFEHAISLGPNKQSSFQITIAVFLVPPLMVILEDEHVAIKLNQPQVGCVAPTHEATAPEKLAVKEKAELTQVAEGVNTEEAGIGQMAFVQSDACEKPKIGKKMKYERSRKW